MSINNLEKALKINCQQEEQKIIKFIHESLKKCQEIVKITKSLPLALG